MTTKDNKVRSRYLFRPWPWLLLLNNIQLKLFQSEKIIEEQKKTINAHQIDEEEYKFLKLNLEFGPKCAKKTIVSKGYKIGTPEYKKCVLRRGIKIND